MVRNKSRVHSIVGSEDRREIALWISHHTMTFEEVVRPIHLSTPLSRIAHWRPFQRSGHTGEGADLHCGSGPRVIVGTM